MTMAPDRLPESLRQRLTWPAAQLFVSAASAMEIATKVRIGKLEAAKQLTEEHSWDQMLRDYRAIELPISLRHSLLAGSLDWQHRDPFDRFLAAQSILDDLPLVTADRDFAGLTGLTTLWE
jgi:PIN domain nuclease of toxin-antitoxin system